MPPLRLCSHIKTNGIKCGSPALRHHTLCYFHYQWQRRDQRRIRLGGPVGMNKNTGIELPLLDGPEAIIVSIGEIQHALVDQRIPIKMGTALLYSLQLALQARIPYSGLCAREPVRECPELDMELEMERAKSRRPAKEKCSVCPKQETCVSPRACKKLPKLPPGYRRQGDHLVRDTPEVGAPFFAPAFGAKGGAVPDTTTTSSSRAMVAICRSRAAVSSLATAVEGPAFPPTEATTLSTTSPAETGTAPLRECSPGREPGESAPKFPPSRAHARRQIDAIEENQTVLRLRDSRRSAQDDTSRTDAIPNANNILGFKPNALIDLAEKFPQPVETTRTEIQGGIANPALKGGARRDPRLRR